jgi:glyoxalase family protein
MHLTGLHHVTAVTARASKNVAFYTQTLGMRLVKKTVNQDDVSAYHFFYADAAGSPGTDLTFFDWENIAKNRLGAGSITETGLRVPTNSSLEWWAGYLSDQGVEHTGVLDEGGRFIIRFTDGEGQPLALVENEGYPGGIPWEHPVIPHEHAIIGLHHVKIMVADVDPTAQVLTEVLGFEEERQYTTTQPYGRQVIVYATEGGGAGKEVHVIAASDLPRGRVGYGGVHHVAFRVPDAEAQLEWRERILQSGLGVTPVIDRFYFKSIYFREPGGILYEIATDGPGFAVDEDAESLGESLALPPFLEPRRQEIEAGLKPVEVQP